MSCPDCFAGHVHEGTPKGRVEKMFGLDTYITDAPEGTESKGVIVYIPDVFGWDIPNARLLADRYAQNGGFTVYLPDFMNGNSVPQSGMIALHKCFRPGFLAKLKILFYMWPLIYHMIKFKLSNDMAASTKIVTAFFEKLRASTTQPIGVAGFCWGGYFTFKLCQDLDGKDLVDCGYTAHPSMLKVPEDMEQVKKPISVGIGSDDIGMNMVQVKGMQAAFKKNETAESEVVTYDGAKHGFATRANPFMEKEAKQAEDTEAQAIAWFTHHMVKS